MQPQVSPNLRLSPVKAERVFLPPSYQHPLTIRAETYEGVNHNLLLNEGINLAIDLLSAEEHCRLSYMRYFGVMLLTRREK